MGRRPGLIPETLSVALRVAEALDRHGVRYLVGGSLASSVCGEPRSTLDIDLVVALREADVDALVADLGNEFLTDPAALRRAIRERSSANLIHEGSSTKVDLFVAGGSPVDALQMERRIRVRVAEDPERYLWFYTAEDILVQKLRWYRLGGEVSERQWRDVLGILRVQGEALDASYLGTIAERLGVADLLARARSEVATR